MSQSDRWAILISELGVETAAEPVPPAAPSAASAPPVVMPSVRPNVPAAVRPNRASTDWSRLAGDLGLEPASVTPSAPPVAPPAARRSPPPAPPQYRTETIVSAQPSIERQVASSAKPDFTRDDEHDGGDLPTTESESGEASQPGDSAGNAERPRRRRRRGGRGRSRRGDRDREPSVPGASAPADDFDDRAEPLTGDDHDSWEELPASADDHAEDRLDTQPTDANREGRSPTSRPSAEEEARPKGRRRRRRGRGKGEGRNREERPLVRGEEALPRDHAEMDHDDLHDPEPRRNPAHADDVSHDHDEDHDENGDFGLDKSHRTVPSWQEAIGLIVAVNLEAREKSPHSRPANRGRGRGGRPRGGRRDNQR